MLIHTHFSSCWVLCPPPTEHRIHSVATHSANAFEGYIAKRRSLYRDVTNCYTLIISRATMKQHNLYSAKGTALSIPTGTSRNAMYPLWNKTFLLITATKKGCPGTGHPFAYYLRILLYPSLLSEYFCSHAFSSFRPSSLAYNFWISGARNRAKESMMDCGSSISYGF